MRAPSEIRRGKFVWLVMRPNVPGLLMLVEGDPNSAGTFYATFSGFSGFTAGDTLGHVFRCTTAGVACADISGNLPNIPVNDIVIDPAVANQLWVATDTGVYRSTNGGGTWTTF